jgi:hypothetical protein
LSRSARFPHASVDPLVFAIYSRTNLRAIGRLLIRPFKRFSVSNSIRSEKFFITGGDNSPYVI